MVWVVGTQGEEHDLILRAVGNVWEVLHEAMLGSCKWYLDVIPLHLNVVEDRAWGRRSRESRWDESVQVRGEGNGGWDCNSGDRGWIWCRLS